jgi:methylated-DNA-[protein]-cysteine S-methyltransferase
MSGLTLGAANGTNPIPIVIPCHRVIGANGKLTGFGGGLPIKEKLLALEAKQLRLSIAGDKIAGATVNGSSSR